MFALRKFMTAQKVSCTRILWFRYDKISYMAPEIKNAKVTAYGCHNGYM